MEDSVDLMFQKRSTPLRFRSFENPLDCKIHAPPPTGIVAPRFQEDGCSLPCHPRRRKSDSRRWPHLA